LSEPSEEEYPGLESRTRRLLRYFRRYWVLFVVGIVFLVATNICALLIPRQIGSAVQALQDATSNDIQLVINDIKPFAITIMLLAVGAAVTRIASRLFIFYAGRYIESDVRNELFEKLTNLSVDYFEKQSTGDLVSRIINDVNNIRVLFGFSTLNLVNTVVTFAVVLSLMFSVSPELTWYSLAPYPIIMALMMLWTRALYTRTQESQEQLANVSTHSQEALSGVSVIKAFSMQPAITQRFRGASDDYVDINLKLAMVRGSLFPFVGSIGNIGALIVLWFGGQQVIGGEIQLGTFVEFSGYITALAWPTAGLGWALTVWQRGTASFDRLSHILARTPTIRDANTEGNFQRLSGEQRGRLRGDIEFDHVTLEHDDGTVALSDVDITIPGGSTVAIVGRTGAGKSTIVDLLSRLRDPTTGTISIGGRDLRDIPVRELRACLGLVPQDPFLFSRSVRDNIRLGVLAREHEEDDASAGLGALSVNDASQIAHLGEALDSFEDGLDTLVGERGITLSGGQKQRVTIARALILDPDILILDDALSSVDTQTERRILEEFEDVMKDRTTVLITHRFNALELVDRIYVLEGGKVWESGSHEELIARNGLYAEMVERQRIEEELDQ
jgi:ATP-binding cassette subfamily B protein